ncbi:MAG: PAS domain S-box protein [Caulobacteraceae bacterium]|nr:PAS domain S-box protein [Caulobacteraceae bacterium]
MGEGSSPPATAAASLAERVLQGAPQSIIATDRDGRIIYWNAFAERLYGWTADEVLGRPILDITPADRAEAEAVMACIEAGAPWKGVFKVRRKDGTTFDAFVTSTQVVDETGAVTGAVGVSLEASSQIEWERRAETLFQSMSEGYALCEAIVDSVGRLEDYVVLEVNAALQAMLGRGPELVGQKFSETGLDSEAWLALCDGVLRTGRPASFEFQAEAVGRWYEIRVNRVGSSRLAQFFFDITERKAAVRRQAELFDELNHRVKNNLAIISALLGAQARGAEPAVRRELIKAADRVQSISEIHGSLTKAEGGGAVDLAVYLRDLCDRLSRSLTDPGVIRIRVEADPTTTPVDRAVPIGIIVNELVTNAIKHAFAPGERGSIAVRYRDEEGGARLSVSDSGAGGGPDLDRAPIGLGMRLVRSLVGQLGGEFAAFNDGGTTFTIRLPAPSAPGGG